MVMCVHIRFRRNSMVPPSDIFSVCPSPISTKNVNRGCPGSFLDQLLWNLWWTKWTWSRFCQSTSASSENSRSTNCSTFINNPSIDAILFLNNLVKKYYTHHLTNSGGSRFKHRATKYSPGLIFCSFLWSKLPTRISFEIVGRERK
jgi:hypothetical protein